MKRRRIFPFAAAGVAVALGLAACGGSSSNKQAPQQKSSAYNAAINGVVNPSSHKGGTLTFDLSSVPDSTDMGNTYYAFMWNTVRLYSRALVTYKSVPGAAGNTIVPDLATSLGQVSSDGLTWTYHLKPNIKFEDGTTVTSKDVKYAVERTYAKDVLPNGPSYFKLLLKDPSYPGPYKDKTPGKKFVLVKNPNWNPATDPNRKQLVNKFVFNLNVNADTIDQNLFHNFAQVDMAGTGVQAAGRARVLSNPALKANADDALIGFLWFTYINTKVKPLDNVHCRRAVEYAADKTAYQTAYGGPVAGGDIVINETATT